MKHHLYTFGLLFAIIGNAQASEITNTNASGVPLHNLREIERLVFEHKLLFIEK